MESLMVQRVGQELLIVHPRLQTSERIILLVITSLALSTTSASTPALSPPLKSPNSTTTQEEVEQHQPINLPPSLPKAIKPSLCHRQPLFLAQHRTMVCQPVHHL